MTQQNVCKLLERKKKWMSVKEIADELKISKSSVSSNLHGLWAGNFVEMEEIKVFSNPRGREYQYRIK